MSKPILIALLGSSGSGKSTIANRLEKKYGFISVRSYSTRKPRENDDADLQTHTFITFDEVEQYRDEIMASCTFNNNFYFATRTQLNNSDVYVIDPCGLKQLKENYKDKQIIPIYIDVPPEIVAARMEQRGDSNEAIMSRLENDKKVFEGAKAQCLYCCPNITQDNMNDICEFIHLLTKYSI